MTDMHAFQKIVWDYYAVAGRHDLPWRRLAADGTVDPYVVLVSELMLQQTQVPRVIPKFLDFMAVFPSVEDLARASLADVIRAWSGLGYNRRAKFLWQAAGVIAHEYRGRVPSSRIELVGLPGVGPNTAGAILAYAFNQPVAYLETNIRSVFIHHFFPGADKVPDAELLPYITATIPPDRPREWYWAIMDYGTHLKQTVGNVARVSSGYKKQSAFLGSRRRVRGIVLKLLSVDQATLTQLQAAVQDDRLIEVLKDLADEGFIAKEGDCYRLGA